MTSIELLPIHTSLEPAVPDREGTDEPLGLDTIDFLAADPRLFARPDERHNDLNGEKNQDGGFNNRSWNCGAEEPTDDPQLTESRAGEQRSLLATLLLGQVTPTTIAG